MTMKLWQWHYDDESNNKKDKKHYDRYPPCSSRPPPPRRPPQSRRLSNEIKFTPSFLTSSSNYLLPLRTMPPNCPFNHVFVFLIFRFLFSWSFVFCCPHFLFFVFLIFSHLLLQYASCSHTWGKTPCPRSVFLVWKEGFHLFFIFAVWYYRQKWVLAQFSTTEYAKLPKSKSHHRFHL